MVKVHVASSMVFRISKMPRYRLRNPSSIPKPSHHISSILTRFEEKLDIQWYNLDLWTKKNFTSISEDIRSYLHHIWMIGICLTIYPWITHKIEIYIYFFRYKDLKLDKVWMIATISHIYFRTNLDENDFDISYPGLSP